MIKLFKNHALALGLLPIACLASIEKPHYLYEEAPQEGYGKLGIRGELLYWKAEWGNVPFALAQTTTTTGLFNAQTQLHVPFNYKPGFRVGANYENLCGQWDLDFLYTRLVESACRSVAATDSIGLYAAWELASFALPATSASANAHQSYQTIDFTLGKKFYWSSPFTLRVYGGFKGALIKERLNVSYAELSNQVDGSAVSAVVNKYNAFGFMSGAKATWDLHRYFALYGRGEIALMEGKLATQQSELLNLPDTGITDLTLSNCNSFNAIKAGFLSELGIQFNIDICDVSRFILYFGYEFNYWPNQIQLTKFNSYNGATIAIPQQSDLGFQGFNLGVEFEF